MKINCICLSPPALFHLSQFGNWKGHSPNHQIVFGGVFILHLACSECLNFHFTFGLYVSGTRFMMSSFLTLSRHFEFCAMVTNNWQFWYGIAYIWKVCVLGEMCIVFTFVSSEKSFSVNSRRKIADFFEVCFLRNLVTPMTSSFYLTHFFLIFGIF